jgi:hypothetical protein
MSPEVVGRWSRHQLLTLRSSLRLPRLQSRRLASFDPSWASRPLRAQRVVSSTPLLFVVLCDEMRISALCHVFSSLTSTKTRITTNGGAFYSLMIPAYFVVLVVKYGFNVTKIQRPEVSAWFDVSLILLGKLTFGLACRSRSVRAASPWCWRGYWLYADTMQQSSSQSLLACGQMRSVSI